MTPTVIDLSPHLDLVIEILARHGVSAEHGPVLFGSRVTGQARRYSDLDIGMAGDPLSAHQLGRLREDLEESSLPITVDVVNLSKENVGLLRRPGRSRYGLSLPAGVWARAFWEAIGV